MFTVLIDESGDTGLVNVQADPSKGPTQYFCMSAIIFRDKHRDLLTAALEGFANKKGFVHCAGMDHFKKVHLCRTLATLPLGVVGVVSNKLSLLSYLSEAKKTPTHYYNKVSQYLFERLGEAFGVLDIPKRSVRIQIEARDQQYSSLLSFLQKIQRNPLDERALSIRQIDPFAIAAIKKRDEPLMAIADAVAHAMFLAVRRDERTFCLNETRYLKELSPIFLCSKGGIIVPKGLKPIHSLVDLGIPQETKLELTSLRNQKSEFQIFSGV